MRAFEVSLYTRPCPLAPASLASGGWGQDPRHRAMTMLPPQCWSSCSPSSQGCSASWTTSTSATPPWRRRWLWPPSCRACSPSQVSHQHSAWSSSRTFSNSSGPAGRRKPTPHSMAFDTLHGLANVLTPAALLHHNPGCVLRTPLFSTHCQHTHDAHATHAHTHSACHTHAHETFSHATHMHSTFITNTQHRRHLLPTHSMLSPTACAHTHST